MLQNDPNIARGIDNVVIEYLRVTSGESVALVVYFADELRAAFESALTRSGAVTRTIDLSSTSSNATRGEVADRVAGQLQGCTAVLTITGRPPPAPLLLGVTDAAKNAKTRHVALGIPDARLLSQGLRASPALLETINERLVGALASPSTVKVTSTAGTQLEVVLESTYPFVQWSGRPGPGETQNLPTGGISVHPASVDGTFVADRLVRFLGSEPIGGNALRRAPLVATFQRGAITKLACEDPSTLQRAEEYLASHPNAPRVGTVFLPANYLVRIETGIARQDMLLPGINVHLGLSSQHLTRAPFDAPVQANLTGRKLNVECRGQHIVIDGRLADSLVAGVDPFR